MILLCRLRISARLFSSFKPSSALFSLHPQKLAGFNAVRFASTNFPRSLPLNALVSNEDHDLAKSWVEKFERTQLQRSDVELSFARSSGPGGQNVNKVNTKAIIRLGPISQTMWIPRWAVDALRNSPAYVKYNDSILISSTKHRSQSDNVQDCLDKLHSLIRDSASAPIKKPLSEETIAKLAASERAFKSRVRKEKEKRSQTKASRRNVGHWD